MVGPWRPAANSLVRIRQERWRVERSTSYAASVVVDVAGVDVGNRGERTSFVLPFDTCDRLNGTPAPRRVTLRGWRRLVRHILATATPTPDALRSAVRARFTPLPFQLEPALAYVRGEAHRMLIADGVGLGKTVQAGLIIAEMLERCRDGRALIVVPGGLREQWRDELRDRFDLDVDVLDAAGLWRASASLPVGVNPWMAARVAVTSIDFVKRPEVLRSLEPLVWDVVVFDEAHALSGRSDRRLAAAGLATRGRAVVLLTATPHTGEATAFERLCGLGDIDGRFPLTVYRRTGAIVDGAPARRSRWLRLGTSSVERALHDALVKYAQQVWSESSAPGARLAMLVLLKRGASSATALSRSLARRRELLSGAPASAPDPQLFLPLRSDDDEEPCVELGAPGLADRERELLALDHLLTLAQSISGATRKRSAIGRLLRRQDEPVIVFTQYRDTLDELTAAFAHLEVTCIHGGMSARERAESARAFTRGTARVLLATDAASEGLNLHARCRLVVSFDLPWTPLRLEQRIGRVDRIGQTRRVHAWQMVASGTYEDIVAERVRARAAMASAAIDRLDAEDERETAGIVLGAAAEGAPRSGVPADLIRTGTAGALAVAEARRIVTARAMMARGAAAAAAGRPFFAVLSHRHGRRVIVGYLVSYADPLGRQGWDTIAGLVRDGDGAWAPTRNVGGLLVSAEAAQLMLDTCGPRLENDLRAWRHRAASALRRDRAIKRLLRSERARLSTALIQPQLFSNRAQRALSPQLQLLDESLSRLLMASADMRAVSRIRLASASPLFAAVLP